MRLIKPKAEILDRLDEKEIVGRIATVARTCYKSEDLATPEKDKALIKRLIDSKHDAMLEFVDITVKFTTSIGITREIIRHRVASYANESTRYCDYSKDKFNNEITFIIPSHIDVPEGDYDYQNGDWVDADIGSDISDWLFVLNHAQTTYRLLRNKGWKAEQAREVLPMSTKSELCMKANLREWRHFFSLRCSKAAHPDIRVLALDLLKQMHEKIPVIFDDLYERFIESNES